MSDSDHNHHHRDADTRRRGHHKRREKYVKNMESSSKRHREYERESSDESDGREVAIDVADFPKAEGRTQGGSSPYSKEPNDYERYMNRVRDTPDGDCFNWTGLGIIVFLVLVMIVLVLFRDGLDHPHSALGEHHDLEDSHKIVVDSNELNVNA